MGLLETEETNRFNFEAFAAHDFYTEINRSLVRKALAPLAIHPANRELTIVDMACGTGSVTRLITEEIGHQKSQRARIIGVDPSAEALRLAQQSIEEMGAKVEFFQGETKDLATIVQDVDAAFFCNAIHLIDDEHVFPATIGFGSEAKIIKGTIAASESVLSRSVTLNEVLVGI